METMKKSTLTIFCILAGCIFFLSGIWIYFQKNLDRVELGEGERATAYQRHYLMIANDKDTGMWQSVYESASKEAESKDAYVELLSPEQMNGYSQADCLKIGIASKVDGIILEADGSKEEQHLITEALKDGIPVVTVMTDDTATSRISFVGLNSYQMGSAYTEQIQGMLKDKGSTSVMFLSTSSSKTQETNLVYSQVKKELESRKKTGQSVDLTEYCVDSSADFDTEEFVRDMFVSDESLPDVIVCMDEIVTECVCQDLRDSVAYLPHRVTVNIGTYEDLGDCDVIVNSIGKIEILRANQDRTDEMKFTVPAVNSYVGRVKASGFDGVVVNITNPCDVVTQQLAKGLGLPRGRVFGTGTGLDTSRLLSALARQTGIDHKSITAYMLGEHGNQQFAAWSNVSFRGKSLEEWAKTDERFRFDRDALQKESIRGGWVTFSGKYCTEYGIATTAARMVSIVLHDEKQIMPASAELCGEYGEKDVFVGVPCVIGKNGVEEVVELSLNEREKEELKKSCDVIRGNIKMVEE